MMLKLETITKINRFFNKLYKVNASIDVYYVDLDEECKGNHDGKSVFVNSNVPELDQEFAVVHEMNHVYQRLGHSATVPDIEQALVEDEEIPYPIRKQEIDSRIVELLYAYDQFGEYGVTLVKDKLYKGCPIFTYNLSKAIFNLYDSKVKELLIKDLDEAYIAVETLDKHYGKII